MAENNETKDHWNIFDLDYWIEINDLFDYLDKVSPVAGSKFKCPVCSGTHWACSSTPKRTQDGEKNIVTLVDFPVLLDHGQSVETPHGKKFPNYHYHLICVTCAHTMFFNAAFVQAKMKAMSGFRNAK